MKNTGFSSDFIEQLKYKNDIVSTISKYISLKRVGNNYWACCPFHNEKTPSFCIKEDRQFYHCFGCGETGDVIKFVQKYENVDFVTATSMLAKNAGMEMPNITNSDELQKKKKQRDKMLEVLKDTNDFYVEFFKSEKGKVYRDYVEGRKIGSNEIEVFKIGASPDYNSLVKHLRKKGYTNDEMVLSGVVGQNDSGMYDNLGTRLTFPIINGYGDIVGFTARDITGTSHAKYKNTPQTLLFNKSQIIYGLHNLREQKKNGELKYVILVEGQIDVIACYSKGFKSTVACMGTALTTHHAREIHRLCENIILCLDNDSAGKNATYKAIETFRQEKFDVKVCRLYDAKDPDEFIKKFGQKAFEVVLENAVPGIDFILSDLLKNYDISKSDDKSKYVAEALSYISNVESPAEQEIYLSTLRDTLNMPIDILRASMKNKTTSVDTQKIENTYEQGISNQIQNAKIFVLASVLYEKDYADIQEIANYFNEESEMAELYSYMKQKKDTNSEIMITNLFNDFQIENDSDLNKIINYNFDLLDVVDKEYYADCLKTLKINRLNKQKNDLKDKLKTAKDNEQIFEYLSEIKKIDEEIKKERL